MKDFIVMIAILILGVVVAGLVMAFKGKMNTVSGAADTALGTPSGLLTTS